MALQQQHQHLQQLQQHWRGVAVAPISDAAQLTSIQSRVPPVSIPAHLQYPQQQQHLMQQHIPAHHERDQRDQQRTIQANNGLYEQQLQQMRLSQEMAYQLQLQQGKSQSRSASRPLTTDYDLKENSRASEESRSVIPNFDRSVSDIYQDELYSSPYSKDIKIPPDFILSYHGLPSERLQAAGDARSVSPVWPASPKMPPFRQGSRSTAPSNG